MKILILDKDGTLVKPASGNKFVQSPEDQELLPGVAEAIALYRDAGWKIAIATNQGGVASGYKSLDTAIAEVEFCLGLLNGVEFAMAAHSYEDQGYGEALFIDASDGGFQWKVVTNAQQKFRKPGKGMIDYLALRLSGHRVLEEEREEILFVGDRPEDEQAAANAKVRFMWADKWREVKQVTDG